MAWHPDLFALDVFDDSEFGSDELGSPEMSESFMLTPYLRLLPSDKIEGRGRMCTHRLLSLRNPQGNAGPSRCPGDRYGLESPS